MRRFSHLLFVATILLNAFIVAPAQSVSKAAPATSAITGRVTAGDDQPVPGAVLVLMPAEFRRERVKPVGRATTGADGFYRLANLPAGSYRLQLLAPAYTSASAPRGGGWNEGQIVNVTAGETIEGQDFKLARGGVITGRVTDADGKPVIGEYLRLMDATQDSSSGRNYAISPYSSETDDRGVYRIYGLPAGRYHVAVGEDKENGAVSIAVSGKNLTRTFHPNATEAAQAKVVEVSADTEATGIDITLAAPAKTYEAAGRVVDALTNQPVPNISYGIGLVTPDGKHIGHRGWGNARTNADGEFRLRNLLPGRYAMLTVARDAPGGAATAADNYYSAPAPFEIVDGNVDGLLVKALRGAVLSGVAVVEGTTDRAAPAKLAGVTLYINVAPAAPQADELQGSQSSRVQIQPDGSFRVVALPPGTAQVSLDPYSTPKGFALLRVERGGIEQRTGIEIGAGEQVAGVRLVLAYGAGVVRGQVEVQRDGAPASLPGGARLQVTLRRKGGANSPWGQQGVEVDARGRFVLNGLVAGEYELTASGWIQPTPGAPQGVGLPSANQTVNVPDKGEINVTLVYNLNAKQ